MKLDEIKSQNSKFKSRRELEKEHLVQMIIEQSLIINQDNYYMEFVKYFQHKCTSTVFTNPKKIPCHFRINKLK